MFPIKWTMVYSTLVLFFTTLILLYILGIAKHVTDFEENTCEMTYMFEYPQYVRISMKNDIEKRYPRFGLYAYGEGFVTEKLRRMYFSGIPVLFIPGNAGSHEQVRSIASVSLRKSLKNRIPFHFDFFTISFSKDYSALYGGILMEQTTYVSHCIRTILALYKGKMDNVVLIGHSMGGIVAKGALLLTPNINASFASMIINLAAPNTPVLVLDSVFANYYHELEKRSDEIKDTGVKVVSIGGGPRDILVTAAQAFDRTADINVLSTSVPTVWKSTDHLSILWCKQLVFTIVRSLFDSVDYLQKPPKITSSPDLKMQALSYHFLQHSSGKKLYHYKENVQFEPGCKWMIIKSQQYVWNNKNEKLCTYLTIEVLRSSDFLTIDTIDLENKDWLFACTASKHQEQFEQKRICEWGWNLTNKTRILPDPLHRLRRIVDLNIKEINQLGVTHIVVRITPDDLDKYLTVSFDSYSYESRTESTRMHPKYLLGFSESNLIETTKGSIRYYVTLSNIMDAVTIKLTSLKCTNSKNHAVVELIEPWNMGATQLRFFTNIDDGPKTMKMQTLYGRRNETASLRMTLDPECIYTINIQPGGIVDKISCRVRDRWPLLYMTIISLLLLLVAMKVHRGPEILPTIAVTVILSVIFNITYEICIALCIVGASAISICCSVIFFGSVAHGIAVRFLARAVAFSTTWSDWLLSGLNQLPFITTIFVLSLIPATCGALAMLISVFLYFLKLTRMYEDYLEEILMSSLQHFSWLRRFRSIRGVGENGRSTSQEIYNHLILFLLWIYAAVPAVPSILVWAKNFSYDTRLTTEDPVLLVSWTTLAACSTLGITKIIPDRKGNRSLVLSSILCFASWIVLSMTAALHPFFYHWYMPPITAVVAVLIALNNIIP